MRPLPNSILAVGLLALSVALAAQTAPDAGPSRALPPLSRPRSLELPKIVQQTLPNGLRLVLLENHKQPALWLQLALPAGSIRDPRDKVGLAQLTAQMLDKGAGTRDESQIADTVDSLGANLSASAGTDFLTISINGLSPQADALFALLADVALRPSFPSDSFERTRRRTQGAIATSLSQAATLDQAALSRLVFGAHPYGSFPEGTPKTLAALTTQDLQQFHDTYFTPEGATLFLVGDLTPVQAMAHAQAAFGSWPRKTLPPLPTAPTAAAHGDRPRIVILDRPGSQQTEIGMGLLTPGYSDPQRITGSVMTAILGGGAFGNRLIKEIRVKRGLSYGARSAILRNVQAGIFTMTTFTKNASTGEVVKIALTEATRLARETVAQQELEDRKAYLAGLFAVRIATPEGLLQQLVPAILYGGGLSDLTQYSEKISEVTADQVRMLSDSLGLSHIDVVLVGDAKAIHDQVAPLGDVSVISSDQVDLLAPTLQAHTTEANAEAGTTGDALGGERLAVALKAHGGDAFLNAATLQFKGKGQVARPDQPQVKIPCETVALTLMEPDKSRLDLSTGFGPVVLGLPGAGATPWYVLMGDVNDAPLPLVALIDLVNPFRLLRNASKPDYSVAGIPELGADGKPVLSLDSRPLIGFSVAHAGRTINVYSDRETGLVRRLRLTSPTGTEINVHLSNYKTVDGVSLPGAIRLDQAKETLVDLSFDTLLVNKPVDATMFKRPTP